MYPEWLRVQGPEVERLGARFRPWEQYALAGTDLRVRVKGFNAEDGTVNVVPEVDAEGTVVPHEEMTVAPERLELWSIPALDDD